MNNPWPASPVSGCAVAARNSHSTSTVIHFLTILQSDSVSDSYSIARKSVAVVVLLDVYHLMQSSRMR